MKFIQFIKNLSNFEKTRNTDFLKDYSLDYFEHTLNQFHLLKKNTINQPLRISVVGTNGKGSTTYFLSILAQKMDYYSQIGTYTSPHLVYFTERICINQIPIPEHWLDCALNNFTDIEIQQIQKLSFFEFFTLLSMKYFSENHCDLEIYEAGLGGRLDATRLVHSEIVVLTSIDLDHTKILGDTRKKILYEKLNICTKSCKYLFFQLNIEDELYLLTLDFAKSKNIQVFNYISTNLDYLTTNQQFAQFIWKELSTILNKPFLEPVKIELLPGPKGRMEELSKEPLILFDIAHNPSGVQRLIESIQLKYNGLKWNIIVGTLIDKDILSILEILIYSEIVQMIHQIIDNGFHSDTINNSKIIKIHTKEINSILQNQDQDQNFLVIGSFRLYEFLLKHVHQ